MSMWVVVKPGAVAALLLAALSLHAQQVYRIVGPDGKVTFSDQPPQSAAAGRTTSGVPGAAPSSAGAAGLPYELRQVAQRYPVTLYTGSNCSPCVSARNFLTARGVPFSERTVTTPEDAEALLRLSGDSSLPFMTLGTQRLKGFSDAEWNQFLTAAGYPQTSVLPGNWRNPPAAPLVAAQRPAAPASQPEAAPAQQATTSVPDAGPAPANPAGIRF
jgi:glutaredoxin